ncbi:hypothetical protein WJX75_001317 [Coccomyxa subellipsoidea]|uniref:GST C-terminal domain-containing protein n=1 Tax=Coccomyxa subellipsoidea TaxID=248742 RepID=A0ABR2YT08_9CHLO
MTRFPDVNWSNVKSPVVATTAIAGVLGVWLWSRWKRDATPTAVPDTVQLGRRSDEITLIGFPRVSDVVSSCSPYVAKVEAWLRFVGLPYTRKNGAPSDSPKGQLPVILHGKNTIGDSYFIIKYLEQTYPEVVMQASPEEQAMSVAVQHLVDDFLNKGLGYYRWVHPEGWEGVKRHFLKEVPQPMRAWLLERMRPKVRSAMTIQGLARHSERDILWMLDEALAALSAILGGKKYILGNQPCIADACAFGFLDSVLFDTECIAPELREAAMQYDNLVSYTERIRCAYFEGELTWEETASFGS